ncbi:MAG TPA: HAMP domain-containing sensor histidine kinase [Chloroflexota bacterium]|nr:HAMP domain-containing sensor histidine kinase [Chloroflexota bacterium]
MNGADSANGATAPAATPDTSIVDWLQARERRYEAKLSLPAPDRRKLDRLRDAAIIRVRSRETPVEPISGVLEPEQRLEMERRRLWTRLGMLMIPVALLAIYGPAAVSPASISAGCVLVSYAIVWSLLRWRPHFVRNGQLFLRLLDVFWMFVGVYEIHLCMLQQAGRYSETFDVLYVLCVVAGVATNGMRGAVLMTVASAVALGLDRWLLVNQGLLELDPRNPTSIALPMLVGVFGYMITASTVLFLMRISGQAATRRERALSAEISSRNAQLEETNQVLRARRQMTAEIAHELRNPLTTISGYVQAIRDGQLPFSAERMDAIYRQTERLNRVIGDLRTLSLADVGALSFIMQPVPPDSLLTLTAENYTVEASARGVKLLCSLGDPLPPVNADGERLAQVLGNLVSNAIRHTASGGQVHIAGRHEDGNVVLTVEDSGEGIAANELPYVFDRFYRASSRTNAGSSGLGLAIVKALVTAHHGTIDVASQVGVGTTFTIRLPALV